MDPVALDSTLSVVIPCGHAYLNGFLHIPRLAQSLVLFVHGSGSSRLSVRNQFVAAALNAQNHATLLFDLLTSEEEAIDNMTREFRFDISLLASRLRHATQWCLDELRSFNLSIGYFGASTGGAAALVAASQEHKTVKAVVSRGGRPDLAGSALGHVTAPTLLIVGGKDELVIQLNQSALSKMTCIKKIEIIPGATHLFEEPGKLDEVARLTHDWFNNYLKA